MDTRVNQSSIESDISDEYLERLSALIHSSGVAETEIGYTEYYFSAENLRKKTFSTQSFEKLDQGFSLEQTISKFPDTVVSGVFLFPFLLKVLHASSTEIRNLWYNLPEYVNNRNSITFRRIDLICREEAKRRCIHLGNAKPVETVIEQVPRAVETTISSEKLTLESITNQYEGLFYEMFDSTTRELSVPDGDIFHRLEEFLQIQNQDKVETPVVKRLPLRDISADNQELSDMMLLLVGLIQMAITEDEGKLTEIFDRWTRKMHKDQKNTTFPLPFFLRVSAVLRLIELQIQDGKEEDTGKTDVSETTTDEIATGIPVKEFLLHANLLIHELRDLELRAKDGGCIEVGEHIRAKLVEVFQLSVPTSLETPTATPENRVKESPSPIEEILLAHESDDKFWNELKTVLQIGHGFWKHWMIFADTHHFPAPRRGTTEAPGGFYKRTLSLADNRRETFIQYLFSSMEKLGYTERIGQLTTIETVAEEESETAIPPSILPTLNTKRQSEVRFFAKLRPILNSTKKDSNNYDRHGFWERWLELAREFDMAVPPVGYRQPIGVFYKNTFGLPNTKIGTFVEYVASQIKIKV